MNAWKKHCLWRAFYLGLLVATVVTVLAMVVTGHSWGSGVLAWAALGVYTLGLSVGATRRRRAARRVRKERWRDRWGKPMELAAGDDDKQDLKQCETIWRRS